MLRCSGLEVEKQDDGVYHIVCCNNEASVWNNHQRGVPASTQTKECQCQLKMIAWKWNCKMWSIDFRRKRIKEK